ncbi:MAG: phosphomannomutase [Candidatus Thiodiazotropha lotti]|nr:phosphomannomutase [Candidatus Thiodiazotropha lotti]MCG7923580.1 phosphomannomutase [Candidatus Thiodiazotropha lotti]MCG7929559.1 phosphomannomutase [Candidatus Thiodiazotropha lotti]MCG8005298.1 phosphomannomutase [Candidatus Thiodiazotropha lotti]MCG8006868.1 phosphomannomutase [Candidatus Thiodiazotropha lotti]
METGSYSISDLMLNSGVRFGTSGARGLVSAITDQVAYSYTYAFLQHLEISGQLKTNRRVAIAGDFRPSTPRIMAAVCKAAIDRGLQVINCGYIPSPAIALYGLQQGIPSIMITGSHIPDDRNGIKFNRLDGEILKEDEQAIRDQVIEIPEQLFDQQGYFAQKQDLPSVNRTAYENYVRRYTNFFSPMCLEGLRIGLYEHSSVARESAAEVLEALGAEVIRLGYSDQFVPVDTEAIRPEDIALAKDWANIHDLDSIVSTDGDGDRPLVSDEKGEWLRGDMAGMLCAYFLNAEWVATPVSSSSAVERSGWFTGVSRTRIGSPYVISAMSTLLDEGREGVVGYEANGGFLNADTLVYGDKMLEPLPTRDALIVIVGILNRTQNGALKVSELCASAPARFTSSNRLKAFPIDLSQERLAAFTSGNFERDSRAIEQVFGNQFGEVKSIDLTDGVRITFKGEDIIHLRPSGNAPELRCYTEADSEQWVREMTRICLNLLEEWRVH